MKHRHHKIPSSRGGGDEESNFEELSPYDHALTHAIDFVLFEKAPRFDFRHPAWPLLPTELQEAVRKEASRRSRLQPAHNKGKSHSQEHCEKISAALKGYEKTPEHIANFKASVKGREAPNKGVPHSKETKQKISEKLKGKTPWNKGKKMK